ncbi:E3 ubiquitin-protein ligase bre1 [Hypoxylon texense]
MHLTTSTTTALLSSSLLLLLLLAHSAHAAQPKPKPKDAILLSEVQSLTLRGAGALTAHRRAPAVPQLKCVSSPGVCALHEIDVMRCANQGAGYDAEDVQWSCAASLPPELKLGSTDVACEGYSSPDDPYVLRGSCGVEYRLVLTEAGERRFPDLANGGGGSGGWPWGGGDKKGSSSGDHKGQSSDPSAVIFGIIFAAVCIWIIYNACMAGNVNNTIRLGGPRRRRNNWGGGGGGFDPGFGPGGGGGGGNGGSGDTWDDPPPPYSASKTSSSTRNATQSEGWRPGFWSGLAGGAAAGYMAGNRGNNRQEPRRYDSGWGAGPSSSGSSSSGSRSTSSARYESTGFGSTSRR